MPNWTGIHPNFTPKLQKEWEERGFDYEKTKMWINFGLKINEVGVAEWLRARYSNVNKLREEHKSLRISPEVFEIIKDFPNYFQWEKINNIYTGRFRINPELTLKQIWLINVLIPNELLRFACQRCGLCWECKQPNTSRYYSQKRGWCQPCNFEHFRQTFDKWTSGSPEIDKFLQKSQLRAIYPHEVLEFIPYEKFTNIERIGEGGFSYNYKADFVDGYGYIENWNIEKNDWDRCKRAAKISLKVLKNSHDIVPKILREITFQMSFSHTRRIVECYGISQEPETSNYIIVMDYRGENMRNYLKKNDYLNFKERLFMLVGIVSGLNSINYRKETIHKDFHSLNIFIEEYEGRPSVCISDFGLSRLINEEESGKIYGMWEFMAPELLKFSLKRNDRTIPYSPASDVYSFSMVAYELFSGLEPYGSKIYSKKFLKKIIEKNLRPNLNDMKAPQLIKNLIERCWGNDPELRPTSAELEKVILQWAREIGCLDSHYINKTSEFYQQYKEIEEKE